MSARLLHATGRARTRQVIVLSGYGIRIAVRGGQLVLEDGVADHRRTQRVARIDGLRRLLVRGTTGQVSFDAIRWLFDVGASMVHLDHDATVLTIAGAPLLDDLALRRAQARAMSTRAGCEIARALLTRKVVGQGAQAARMPGGKPAATSIEKLAVAMQTATSIADLRYFESRAAAAYWRVWEGQSVRFVGKRADRVPAHWQTVGDRRSLLTDAPRKAVSPAHAILNYLYGVLEAEARVACLAVGLDPAMGIIHADKRYRDSFACDLMEPIRPAVDAYVWHLLTTRSLLPTDVHETREGVCRLLPPLADTLAATGPTWAGQLAPLAEEIVGILASDRSASDTVRLHPLRTSADPAEPIPLPRTPLTGRNRIRRRSPVEGAWTDREVAPALAKAIPRRCRECGGEVPKPSRVLCDACLKTEPARRSVLAVATQQKLRALGKDRRLHPETRARHRAHATRQGQELAAWRATHPVTPNPQQFRDEILPRLATVPISTLQRFTGLSASSCKNARSGKCIPHPRHWDAFRRAIAEQKR